MPTYNIQPIQPIQQDNTKVATKLILRSIPLTSEQQNNLKMFGQLNKPEQQQTQLSQGYKKTPYQKHQAEVRLAQLEKLENYQKQEKKNAENIQHAIEVAPYLIPGIGQAMWAGKAVDLATNKLSNDKYRSWGDMVNQTTDSGELVGDITNPGYIIGGVSQVLKKPVSRLTNIPRRNLAISEYITPFGYEGKGKEVKKFLTDYVIKGKDKPDISWMTTRSQYDPVRAKLRGEAWRKYLNVSKESDKLYIKNADGTFRYNPEVIPKENIEFQRQAFKNSGNGNASKEYLTEQLQSAKKGYVGNAGGVTSIIDNAGNFTIKDTWDLMPLQQFNWLPKKIQNIEVGKIVGAKPFTVVDDQIGKVSSNFKSEINWGNWNKEIPSNKPLMDEYLQIEQTAKQNGTWMKNSDGSIFKGTPEQFVQQNSSNFKKAFPEGYNKVYRGGDNENLANRPHPIVFTGDKATAQHYTGDSEFANNIATPEQHGGRALFELYHPKSNNSITINNQGRSWREIPRKYFGNTPPSRDLYNSKGDFTSTDDIAKWMVKNDKNSVRIDNIFDSYDADFVDIINHKQGNYLKSATGNNGMFDMTNPNIYKAIVPAVGLYGLTQSKKQGWKLIPRNKK